MDHDAPSDLDAPVNSVWFGAGTANFRNLLSLRDLLSVGTLDEFLMCEQCDELDQQIARFRAMGRLMGDGMALAAIAEMIKKREAEKRALHPERALGPDSGPHRKP